MIVLIIYCLYYNDLCICKASSICKVLEEKVCVSVCVCMYVHSRLSVCLWLYLIFCST